MEDLFSQTGSYRPAATETPNPTSHGIAPEYFSQMSLISNNQVIFKKTIAKSAYGNKCIKNKFIITFEKKGMFITITLKFFFRSLFLDYQITQVNVETCIIKCRYEILKQCKIRKQKANIVLKKTKGIICFSVIIRWKL